MTGVERTRTVLEFDLDELQELPKGFNNEIRFTQSFAKHFIEKFSQEGEKVLDIFAGFGTTLVAAESKKRIGYGIEFDDKKIEYVQSRIEQKDNILYGSAFEIQSFDLPKFDLCITSPPYMAQQMDVNPLENYSGESSYEEYLDNLENLFSELKSKIKEGGHLVVEVSNMKVEGKVTPLAWDIAERIESSFDFKGEVIIIRKKDGNIYSSYGFEHSYALVFRK